MVNAAAVAAMTLAERPDSRHDLFTANIGGVLPLSFALRYIGSRQPIADGDSQALKSVKDAPRQGSSHISDDPVPGRGLIARRSGISRDGSKCTSPRGRRISLIHFLRTGVPMFKRFSTSLAASLCLLSSSLTLADAATDRVRDGITRRTAGEVHIDRITPTPVPGLFEVVSGSDVFFSDATGRYAIVDGRMVDTEKRQDLTAATLASLDHIEFQSLPLDLAIKTVTGTGRRHLAIFEDPACPICQGLHGALAQLKDVTLYTFTYPIISENSIPAAIATHCATAGARPGQWKSYMEGAPLPDRLEAGCDQAQADVGKIIALGEKYHIKNTPTLILGNGKRIVGGIPAEQLAAALDEAGQ
jgi:thiol:disulfide interchange protein DsbC